MESIQNKSVNALKFLGVDQINQANSGHPGIVLSSAPIVYTIFKNHLVTDPKDSRWFNRDRFVLSAGHGSALLYATLHLSGFNLSIDDLKNFRKIGLTPGHPEYKHTEGVEITTGPLGQGIANSVGMALAEKHLSSIFNKDGLNIIDHYTYCLCGDGDLQEGVALEAISLAGRLKLDKLIVLYDSNDIQLDGPTKMACADNYKMVFSGYNWDYIVVSDGSNLEEINNAINWAKTTDKPTMIEVKTIIGKDTTNQNTSKVHGSPLGLEERNKLSEKLNWNLDPFVIPKDVYEDFKIIEVRGKKAKKQYEDNLLKLKEKDINLYNLYNIYLSENISIDKKDFKDLMKKTKSSTRVDSGLIFDKLNTIVPNIIGGSADLCASTYIKGSNGDFAINNYQGKNIRYGVREHAMGAINNGIMVHGGLRPVGAGFFVFSDYMKGSIRLSALMNIPSVYFFSHDSVAVGEDGPTHQPIEQLVGLRAIPNLNLFRPADFNETLAAIKVAFESTNRPTVIITSRQDLNNFKESKTGKVAKGGYILIEENKNSKLDLILLSAGSEVTLCYEAMKKINNKYNIRLVSMPSINKFLETSKSYQEKVLPKGVKILAVEAGSPISWYKFTNNVIGIDTFGISCNGNQALKLKGMSIDNVIKHIKSIMKEGF